MSISVISLVLVAILILMLCMGQPLSWSLGAAAVVLCLMHFDTLRPITSFVNRIFDMAQSSTLMAVPLFVMMASILQRSGVAENLFKAAYIWAGGLRGGLAIGTIFANIIMAAMVGVVGAEIVTLGMVALPQMLKHKYDNTLALGTLAAGGGLATLIPPSVVFIVYGMTASVSVAQLFTAGILPGLILAFGYIAFIVIHCKRHPEAAPLPPQELRNLPFVERLKVLKTLALPCIITFGVLGSIYLGVATPNEAAGVGVVLVIICSLIMKTFNLKMLWESCLETVKVSCMLSWLFFGAQTVIGAYTLAG
ncbi:MAG: TRAP transporter large permease subunit, partial [Deltaproteobacteria bacterium]|nr:TRAP transporter large permease subunit [Deltaproteobacteria bacterium]